MVSKEIGQRRGVPSLVAVLLAAGLVAFVFALSGNSACPPQQQVHVYPEAATAGDGEQQRRRTGGAGRQQRRSVAACVRAAGSATYQRQGKGCIQALDESRRDERLGQEPGK